MRKSHCVVLSLTCILLLPAAASAATCRGLKVSEAFYTDWSGQVTVSVSRWVSGPAQHVCTIGDVPSGYVLIGGGAYTQYSGAGGLLTASHPNTALTRWTARSKDHSSASYHHLYVQVVGLKLQGVSESQLRSHVDLERRRTLVAQQHPEIDVRAAFGYTLIGGGAEVHWSGAGNLLTASYPQGNYWNARSKDHSTYSPATITAYAIGIRTYIPGFGYLDVDQPYSLNYPVGFGTSTRWATNDSGWVPACAGARSTYNNHGRLLTAMKFNGDDVDVTSKDHSVADSGSLKAYIVQVRKRP